MESLSHALDLKKTPLGGAGLLAQSSYSIQDISTTWYRLEDPRSPWHSKRDASSPHPLERSAPRRCVFLEASAGLTGQSVPLFCSFASFLVVFWVLMCPAAPNVSSLALGRTALAVTATVLVYSGIKWPKSLERCQGPCSRKLTRERKHALDESGNTNKQARRRVPDSKRQPQDEPKSICSRVDGWMPVNGA